MLVMQRMVETNERTWQKERPFDPLQDLFAQTECNVSVCVAECAHATKRNGTSAPDVIEEIWATRN